MQWIKTANVFLPTACFGGHLVVESSQVLISDGDVGNFRWHNPSGFTVAVGCGA